MTIEQLKANIPDNVLDRIPVEMQARILSKDLFVDIHTHIFTIEDVPSKYLGIRLPFTDKFLNKAEKILHWIKPRSNDDKLSNLAYFIDVISNRSSRDIYTKLTDYYDPNTVFGILMMDMSVGIDGDHPRCLSGQMDELRDIRNAFPDRILPYVAIDPRRPKALDHFNKAFSKTGGYQFFGLKVYPCLGYLPTHPTYMQMFEVCQAKGIPVLTHCSGATVHSSHNLIKNIQGVKVDEAGQEAKAPSWKIFIGKKSYANFFNNPRNWEPVLRAFPNLRLNLAHFGGGDQWEDYLKGKSNTWVHQIMDLMQRYQNVYADFAYTLTDKRFAEKLKDMMTMNPLVADRTLFGSDYYMLVREGHYREMLKKFRDSMGQTLIQKLAVDNPLRHLF